ncbi:MAG: DUF2062 domain-containing protein [Gammaproteobacteria bacterium]|nr:DUF2062 domain-containing protein [Gammaproteobacteria bacterium]
MPKQLIKRITPNREVIRQQKHLRIFGELLHDANLWHINRRSSAGAFAIGLFMAFVPVPFQMILAAGAAILLRVNLPLSVALVWVTNPLTIPPMFFFAYTVGTWFLGVPPSANEFDFSLDWFKSGGLDDIWVPFLFGCLICGATFAIIGYLAIRGLWRLHAVRQWKRRTDQRHTRRKLNAQ